MSSHQILPAPEALCLIDYLVKKQGKSQLEAEQIAQKVQGFIESRQAELPGDHIPQLYFSSKQPDRLPRTIQFVPEQDLVLIWFNKKRKMDITLGKGAQKTVHEAFDYKTGKVFARVMNFSEKEKICADRLKNIPGIVTTHFSHQYTSPKSNREKMFAIQEKINGTALSDAAQLQPTFQQKCDAIKTLFKTIDAIHKKGIAHGDISSQNILLTQDFKPIIIDFGQAYILPQDTEWSDENRWIKGSDLERMAGVISFLCYGIMDTEEGDAFIRNFVKGEISLADAPNAFDELLKIPGFSEKIQLPLPDLTKGSAAEILKCCS